jgi:hypothetical protein
MDPEGLSVCAKWGDFVEGTNKLVDKEREEPASGSIERHD